MNRTVLVLCWSVLAWAAGSRAHAADYWGYTYKDFDVTAAGTAEDALSVGQRLSALDETLRKLLRLPETASEPPTRVYAPPQGELAGLDALWSSQGGGYFRAAPFEDYLVLHSESAGIEPEVNAARIRSLLTSWGLSRLPDWYRHGIELLASAASFDHDHLTIGQDLEDRTALVANDWIPMAQFMRLPASDPLLHGSPKTEALYEAQCWWLVHLSLLDGVLDKVMPLYLQRLLMGESHEAAYSATFGLEYTQLDNYFRKVRHNLKPRSYTVALPDLAASAAPHALSAAEVKARLAELVLTHAPQSEAGAQMANEALATEPKNARALLAVAQHDMALRHYAQAQQGALQLGAVEELSAQAHRDLGALLSNLARIKDEGMPGTAEVDSKAARAGARLHYQRAIALAPDDPRAPYQLGWLLCGQGDVAATRELLPKVEAAFYRRPESAEFAELLVRMHSIAGTPADVFKYAVAEQRLATTDAERARATARVDRLRAQLKAPQ